MPNKARRPPMHRKPPQIPGSVGPTDRLIPAKGGPALNAARPFPAELLELADRLDNSIVAQVRAGGAQ